MSVARFRVTLPQPFDGAREATVVVDRERGTIQVRLLKRRKVEVATLGALVHSLLWKAAIQRSNEKAAIRRKAKRERHERRLADQRAERRRLREAPQR